uniref:Transposase n=1 Tax=Ditylenchus dipsaci TaxID=166011 RepID=A0A915DMJ2_9BILA
MGDGDTTISAAAKNVWMLIKRAMCYAHVKMNLKKKLQPKVMTWFSEEELGLMYNELQNNSFVDWKRYELIRHRIRIVRPSTIWLGYGHVRQRETVLSA